jgi:RNA polymerase sigma-70 factor (ECF subfamily)
MTEEIPDHILMSAIAQGDEASLRLLIERHQRAVYGTICKMINDPSEAEDLAQRVFLRVYQSAPRYRPEAQFNTWLMTIVRNLVLNEYRRRQRKPWESLFNTEDDSPREFSDPVQRTPDEHLAGTELAEAIDAALQELPEKQRLAMILSRYHDMPYEEIAKTLKTSLSSTKSLIFRARETLKVSLKKYLE